MSKTVTPDLDPSVEEAEARISARLRHHRTEASIIGSFPRKTKGQRWALERHRRAARRAWKQEIQRVA